MELIQGRCESCGRGVCKRCLTGLRCDDCPQPAPKPSQPAEPADGTPKDLLDPLEAGTWVFAGPDWGGKLALGGLLTLLTPLLVPLYWLLGYQVRIARQQHEQPGALPLPPFERLGNLFVLGAKHALALALPVLASILVIATPFGFVALWAGGPSRAAVAMLLTMVLYVWVLFLSMAYPLVIPAIEIEYLRTGSVGVGFRPGALWKQMSAHPGDYLLLTIFYWILATLGGAGAIACGVGILVTAPWAAFATGCLLGRYLAHQDGRQRTAREQIEALLAADPTRRTQAMAETEAASEPAGEPDSPGEDSVGG
jgi:hypothetical protein